MTATPIPHISRSLGALLISLLVAACSDSSNDPNPSPPRSSVFASNYPLAYFAEYISDDPNLVTFPEIDGDPAFWKPSPDDVRNIQNSGLILFNGAGYEKWAPSLTLPRNRVVDTSTPFQENLVTIQNTTTHSHGPEGDHSHEGTAFTTWIDLSQASQQASAVADALVEAGLVHPDTAEPNHYALTSNLNGLDNDLKKLTAQNNNLPLVASHPVYDYLARRYHLNIQPVLWEPDVPPNDEQWTALEKILQSHPAKWMIWEDTPLPESVDRLKTIGIESVVFNPAGNRPEDGDFLSVMQSNINNLKPVFTKQ
ncbi:MAG: metal ABC transporter substrate-binding protein [Verrucomicrobiota bacterium]